MYDAGFAQILESLEFLSFIFKTWKLLENSRCHWEVLMYTHWTPYFTGSQL